MSQYPSQSADWNYPPGAASGHYRQPGYQPGYQQPPLGQPLYGPPSYGYAPLMPVVPMVARKEPGISLLVSFFVPGVGTMINGETGKGIGILVGYFSCAVLSFLLIPIIGMIAFWVWGLVDAYQGAQRFNIAHGLMP